MKARGQNSDDFISSKSIAYTVNNFLEGINTYLQQNERVAIGLLDISNFRFYNYMYGYECGNKVLEMVFQLINQCINKNGHAIQFGGGVYLILLDKVKDKDDVQAVIRKIMDVFERIFELDQYKIKIVVNIGITLYPFDGKNIYSCIQNAEIALNYVKNKCKSKYATFDKRMFNSIMEKGKIQMELINAVYNKEFIVYYQPLINISTKKVYGVEALIRWSHPSKGILTPAYFIDEIEENGLVVEIGKYIFSESCRQLARFYHSGLKEFSMSINVSVKQLEDETFLTFVERTIEETGVDPKYINVEITERTILNFTDTVLNTILILRNKGIKIFIDDFGTKYSSLNYLYSLPIDGIKIDKSFIKRLQKSEKELIVIKNIIRLAKELNIDMVAEGVETDEQLRYLKKIGCSKIQGFLFCKPLSDCEIIDEINWINSFRLEGRERL